MLHPRIRDIVKVSTASIAFPNGSLSLGDLTLFYNWTLKVPFGNLADGRRCANKHKRKLKIEQSKKCKGH